MANLNDFLYQRVQALEKQNQLLEAENKALIIQLNDRPNADTN